jgi:hypothetical protein
VTSPSTKLLKKVFQILSLVPLILFFLIILVMFLKDFQNPVDEYFVRLVLKSCLILLFSAMIAHIGALAILGLFTQCHLEKTLRPLKEGFAFVSAFPLLETGIFSIVLIFFRAPEFKEWVYIVALLQLTSTIGYWQQIFRGPIQKIYNFARMHQIPWSKRWRVLMPYAIVAYIDYFFLLLKRALLPFVFILVVMDFKMILPRLAEAGMSYQAYVMFLSLVVSLHLLSVKEEPE